ncbi:MAG: response regulator [Deferrisomatales bacterium]|nr:response regulator [Deferrisomatales bacterium]
MREIIAWLRQVEEMAAEAYREVADHFSDDSEFSSFLTGLEEDEILHYHVMGSAAVLFEAHGEFPTAAIELDDATRARVETPLRRCVERVRSGQVTQADVIADLVEAEHSEWNHIFIYVIRKCQGQSRAFQRVASIVDAHGRKIDAWKNSLPEKHSSAHAAADLPRVWKPRILIVEDDASLRELFRKILADLGEVVTAVNGEEGLRRARSEFFDVILSDQDMPIMTGLELFRLGKELDENMGQHFILCTGNATSGIRLFCKNEGLRLLEKPVSITILRDAVLAMVEGPIRNAATA